MLLFPLIVALVFSLVAAVYDWRTGQIPNALVYPVLLLMPFVHFLKGLKSGLDFPSACWEGGYSVFGAALCAAVPFLLYRQNAIGGGDVKMLAALGAILQMRLGVETELYSFVLATLIAPAKLAYEGKLFPSLKNSVTLALNTLKSKEKQVAVDSSALTWLKFGPFVFLGTALTTFFHWQGDVQ